MPLLKPEHFAGTGIDAKILDDVRIPLSDPWKREEQLWLPGGLIDVLRLHAGDRTSQVAGVLADRAIADNPWGLVKLGIVTLGGYFNHDLSEFRLWSDLGYGELPSEATVRLLRERFHFNVEGVARTPSLIFRYFEYGAVWLVVCLFALVPLALAMLVAQWKTRREPALLLALLAVGIVFGEVLCSHIISYRYLHPLPMLLLLCAAALLDPLLPKGSALWISLQRLSAADSAGAPFVLA